MKYYPVEEDCNCGGKIGIVVYQYGNLVYECDTCDNKIEVAVEKES